MDPPPTPLPNGDNNHQPGPPFDTDNFRTYLRALLPPVIAATQEDLDSLFDDTFDDRVAKFASEPGAVLYVVKAKNTLEDVPEGV
jgi:dynein heavy chain 1